MKKGFTLLEALITIAVIALLAAILLPVLVGAKRSALRTDDISKLRQMGQAAAMYEEHFGEFPLSDTQLVNAGFMPEELCASSRDETADGIANMVARFTNRRATDTAPSADYKNTFVGLREFGMAPQLFKDYVLTGPSAGWLIDATESKRNSWPTPSQWQGTYRRLCVDGSVVVRQHKDFQCYNNGEPRPCRMPVLLFVDPSPYFAELQKSNDQSSSSPQG